MYWTILLGLHIFFVALMILFILLQKSEGGGLGMGGNSFMSARGSANLLTRITGILAIIFFLSTFGLSVLFKGNQNNSNIFQDNKAKTEGTKQTSETPETPKAQKK